MFGRKTWMAAAAASALIAAPAAAQDAIKIGNTMPYSGPASAYGTIGKTIEAYFNKVNAEGGVAGRQIEWISYDDGYSPPKTVEQVRRLVEQDEVDILFATLGTPTNTAIHKYVNAKKVPHLFVSTGASKWNDPSGFPMTTGWQPNYPTEGAIYAKYIMDNIEDPKIAILYQNDDYGKDYLHGMKMGLGDKADSLIVAETPYEVAQPTVDSEVISLKASGANVFFIVATPKFAAQAIKKSDEIGWEAERFLNNVSVSVGGVLQPAGLEASKGLISAGYMKEPTRSGRTTRRWPSGARSWMSTIPTATRPRLSPPSATPSPSPWSRRSRRPVPTRAARRSRPRRPRSTCGCRSCCPASR